MAASKFASLPTTKLGGLSAGLAGAFVASLAINYVAPTDFPGTLDPIAVLISVCGVLSGGAGLLALVHSHERSWVVWLAVLVGIAVVVVWGLLTVYALYVIN